MKSRFIIRILFLLLILPCIIISPAHSRPLLPNNFDAYVEQVRQAFEVPGIAVTVVFDGQVVLAKGYGVKKINGSAPVDEHTLFGIASNTKAFTATALAMLVEEGKIKWDDPVIKHLPAFRLSDPYVTNELNVRDLLVHRSGLGLGAGDLLWWPTSDLERKEIVHKLRYVPLSTSFRDSYAYDNVLYLVAGELIEAVSGQSWESFVKTRILDKIGMSESTINQSERKVGPKFASPHGRIDGVVREVATLTTKNVNPAAGINSSASDMAKWLIVQLDSGRVTNGTTLFSPRTTKALWSLVTPRNVGNPPADLAPLRRNFSGYGLGFGITDYRDRKLVSHTGSWPGYVSRIAMVPEMRLGIAVLTNQEAYEAYDAIIYHILDHYLRAPQFDWLQAYKNIAEKDAAENREHIATARAKRDATSQPSLPLASYAATYTDDWYGDVVIKMEGNKLVMDFTHTPSLIGDLEHWQHNTFIVRWRDRETRADAYVTFSLVHEGTIEHATMRAVSPATDFSFDFHDLRLRPVSKMDQ
ncbi:serine hydrolase [candidate division KSB1 bacterium]|nr:serine hydrolase [candidate division KSB1 bacterium]